MWYIIYCVYVCVAYLIYNIFVIIWNLNTRCCKLPNKKDFYYELVLQEDFEYNLEDLNNVSYKIARYYHKNLIDVLLNRKTKIVHE